MKITLSWLKEFLDTDATVVEIAEKLTAIGLEVESVSDAAQALAPFLVARIEEASAHPGADKLRVCKVDDGKGIRQIVCGAPNARAGINVVLAVEGVKIPANGMVIKKSTIRGVESNGMLCSGQELGLDMDGIGIIELPGDAIPGQSAAAALGLGDPVIDIAVTPNRADCLSIYGIARDLAAADIGKLLPLLGGGREGVHGEMGVAGQALPNPSLKREGISVTLETPACPLFVGYHLHGVKNGPSPEALRKKLQSVGLRPISALVDITNYMTLAYGRPLHVFDAAKLKGGLTVRMAKDGETLRALDGKDYALDSGMLTVCDDSGVIALAGVMGGVSTACDEHTTDVLLESAYFEPAAIAHTGRTLGLESDARYRFERGVDPAFVSLGADIAARMIVEWCGGEICGQTRAGAEPQWQRSFPFDSALVQSLGGLNVPQAQGEAILKALGMSVCGGQVSPPSWRADMQGPADIVEEILRIAGYDAIPATPLPAVSGKVLPQSSIERAQLVRKTLAGRGLNEICSWSFIPHMQAAQFGGGAETLRLLNPINSELDTMRPSLLPGLLAAASRNAARGFADLALFELGNVFADATPQGQKRQAATLRTGLAAPRNPFKTERGADLFDAKGDCFAVLEAAGLNPAKLAVDRQVPSYYHPARAGRVSLGGKATLAYFGELHPLVLSQFGIKNRAAAFEAFLDAIPLPKAKGTNRSALRLSPYQAVERDFAFVGSERTSAGDIAKAIEAVDKQLIRSIDVFDVYAGKGMEPGQKSLALSLTLQAADRTLTEPEIEALSQKVIAAVKPLGLTLRQ